MLIGRPKKKAPVTHALLSSSPLTLLSPSVRAFSLHRKLLPSRAPCRSSLSPLRLCRDHTLAEAAVDGACLPSWQTPQALSVESDFLVSLPVFWRRFR